MPAEEDEVHADGDVRSWCRPAASTACAAPASSGPRTATAAWCWSTPTRRPPRRPPPACRPRSWPPASPGPLALRVVSVLEQSVNPSIASHGGRADLLALDEGEGIAYLRLSGGCQGAPCRR